MTSRGLVGAVTVWAAIVLRGVIAADAPAAAQNDFRNFVFFGASRPLLIRLHFRIDDESLESKWQTTIDALFASIDRDVDGTLSAAEAEQAPPAELLGGLQIQTDAGRLISRMDTARDGKVTRDEFKQYYRESGFGPLLVQVSNGGLGAQVVAPNGESTADGNVTADALNAALFKALDQDGDGKLSQEELTAAPVGLRKLDQDGDGVITPGEVASDASYPSQPVDRESVVFRELRSADQPTELAMQIMTRYGTANARAAGKVARQDATLDKELFNDLDQDHDDVLTTGEVVGFPRRSPDAEFVIRLGDSRSIREVGAKMAEEQSEASADKAPSQDRRLNLDHGLTQFILRVDDKTSDGPRANDIGGYKAQFAAADADANGYLDAKEARQSPFFRGIFSRLDADGDGMLFEKEIIAYFDKLATTRDKARTAQATLMFSEQGRGLFDRIDANRDGRLGLRELRDAAKQVMTLDANHDGQIDKGEIPRSYEIRVQLGQSLRAPAADIFMSITATPELKSGPLWFRKMDRNYDGDVSRAEFLGADEQFAAIDADGDGLISSEEAERADVRYGH